MPKWLANLPSNYTAQMALMGWFLTLTSKMTGFTIPDVGLAPGGKIEQSRDAIAHYLLDMETIADAMAVDKYWDRPQYAILKEMYLEDALQLPRQQVFLSSKKSIYSLDVQGPGLWQVPPHVRGVPRSQVPGGEGQQEGLPRDQGGGEGRRGGRRLVM